MAEHEQPKQTEPEQQPQSATDSADPELSNEQLDQVAGGGYTDASGGYADPFGGY